MKKKESKGTVILIDASHMMYRAYHAFSSHNLTSAEGEPTGAVFGTMNSLQQIIKDGPTHIAFVLDGGGKNHRHRMYPEYKAGRPPAPDDMNSQINHIKVLVKTLGIRVLRRKGEEADDIIGSLAVRAAKEGYDVIIVSGDKDFNQLVGRRIMVYNQQKRQYITTRIVIDTYGVKPKQFVDYLALMGDKVDNIPGVPGCGPKTAADWLQKYPDVETLLGAKKLLRPAHVKLLREHRVHALMSKRLAKIKTAMKGLPSIDSLRCKGVDHNTLAQLRKKLGFRYGLGAGLRRQKGIASTTTPPKKGLFGNVKKK